MSSLTLVAVLFVAAVAAMASGELVVSQEQLFWIGGDAKTLDEAKSFCESVSHGLMPVMYNTESRILQYSLPLPHTAEEFWTGAVMKEGHMVWSEGSYIDDYWFIEENKCNFAEYGVTVQESLNHGIRLRVRDASQRFRSLCRMYIPNQTVLPRLAELWKYLDIDDKVRLTKSMPNQMIQVNTQRLQALEQRLEDVAKKIAVLTH